MSDRQIITPPSMQSIIERSGYAPAVKVGATLYLSGQIGRDADLKVIEDPRAQFEACWENLRQVLHAGGCTFDDVVEMTTFHVSMSEHMPVFVEVKNRLFPRGTYAWTAIGVAELARAGLLVEIKCVAVQRPAA